MTNSIKINDERGRKIDQCPLQLWVILFNRFQDPSAVGPLPNVTDELTGFILFLGAFYLKVIWMRTENVGSHLHRPCRTNRGSIAQKWFSWTYIWTVK
jgi:hypothetical protein